NSQNLSNIDYNEVGLHGDALTHYIITLLTPAKAKKIEIHLAHGLDSMIESKDKVDSHILKCNIINGGHSERLWGEWRQPSEDGVTILNPPKDYMGASVVKTSSLEMTTTHPNHISNICKIKANEFIQKNNFYQMLAFLESAIYDTKAQIDTNNLSNYTRYDMSVYGKDYKCLNEIIQAIYKRDWISEVSMQEVKREYINDLSFFQSQWNLTLNENHQSVTSFVDSFCRKAGCMGLRVIQIISTQETMELIFSQAIIEIKSQYQVSLNTQKVFDRLFALLRQWYIVYKSQYHFFSFHLKGYMRYIEINLRYFRVYDTNSKDFWQQVYINDLARLRKI
ncbi:hypothetical protein CQA53_10020, partial [Helicobacter didelphidarum]